MMKCFSVRWRSLLLTVPMLVCSLTSQGQSQVNNYHTEFGGGLLDGNNGTEVLNGNYMPIWTVTTTGTVNDLRSSDNGNGAIAIEFTLSPQNSLTLTSVQTFSGALYGIQVDCDYTAGLVIKAYVGQTEIGELAYTKLYDISGLSYGLLSDKISLKFMVASGTENGVSVSGLRGVTVYVDETVAPLNFDSPVTFDPAVLSSADLSNYTYRGILFTLNESNGDGFVQEDNEGVIYIGTTLTDGQVETVNNKVKNQMIPYHPGYSSYADDFAGGMTMMVTRGKGRIGLEADMEPGYAFHVKIGDESPVEVSSTTRQWLEVPYNVSQNTNIYIYMVEKSAAARGDEEPDRAGTRIGKRGTAHGRVFSTRCSSVPVDVTDISVYVDYIMGRDTFIYHNADINNDAKINVADIVELLK